MGWLFYCNTVTLKKFMLPLFCSTLDNYVIVKTCSRDIRGGVTPVYNEKINLEVFINIKAFLRSFAKKAFYPDFNFCYSKFNHITTAYQVLYWFA